MKKKQIDKVNIFVTWEEFTTGALHIAQQIKNRKLKFDGIYAIPRGGLPLGRLLGRKLNLPLLKIPTNKSLVVDDISDTGKTLKGVKNKKIACLYTTKWAKIKPNFWAFRKLSKNHWLIFPWEKEYKNKK